MTDIKDSPLRENAPAGNPNSYATKEVITQYLRGVAPDAVTSSGQGYLDLADAYDKAMTELRTFAHDLASAWKGPASNAAQGQLRDLFTAAFQISSRSQQVGLAVKTHGTSYLAWYKANMPAPKTLEEARQWMQGANERAGETWSAIPADISTSLPAIQSGRRELGSPAGGSSSGVPATSDGVAGAGGSSGAGSVGSGPGAIGGAHMAAASGGHGSPGASTHFSDDGTNSASGRPMSGNKEVGSLPAPEAPESTQLSGFSPSGDLGGGFAPEGPAGGYGVGGGTGPGGSTGIGVPAGGAAGGLPAGSGVPLGTGNAYVPGPGAIGGALGLSTAGGAGGSAAGRPGTPGTGFPGTPGHGGRNDKERERGAWLPDDPDIWDGDVEAVPGVIGNASPNPTEMSKPTEELPTDDAALLRRALARLAEVERREGIASPPPTPRRMEWTD
ncbi:WXG100 family type VII secretion target [Actinomadura sp. NTSP31]|uniref:WXG100 family type VII secretion target n=1 Tax=Actinomadura sp. NTSP31 TaxID=1735447 RepID=UPI0035C1193A